MDVLRLTTAMLVLLCTAGIVHPADVYKWKNGKVTTYSQLPPGAGVQSQRIRANSTSALPGTNAATATTAISSSSAPAAVTGGERGKGDAAKSDLSPEQQKLKEQLAKDSDTRLADLARRRADQCTKAHGQFDELTQHARLRVQDAQGNWKILNDGDRKLKLDEVQSRIVEFCS